jgi:eukaryotic-like serine/threonine-protein kinase
MARSGKPLTAELMQEELRFLLKTLMRDDLFGEEVSLTEAEKLLESSLSIGFVEYCAFLKRHAYVDIDRARNTIAVLPRGKNVAEGGSDPSLGPMLQAHFAKNLGAPAVDANVRRPASPPPASVPQMNVLVARDIGQPGPALPPARFATPETTADIKVERYERNDVLGQGSLGTVYKARDAVLNRDVVVKEVRHVFELISYLTKDEITKRVRNAVMEQARLDHPHILRVVDVSFSDEVPNVVVDRAVGGSLRERMQRGPMPVDVALRVILQAAAGLAHAHSKGVIHGGIKPENILFDVAGNVRLSDFGVARVAERPADNTTSAPPVYVGRGNPSYMAPEQLHRGECTTQSDVYGLGIILYEILTGQLPGRRSPMPSQTASVKQALGDGSKNVDDVFDLMTRDPINERYKNFDPVIDALWAALPKLDARRGTLVMYEHDPVPTKPVEGLIVNDPHDPNAPIPVTGSSLIGSTESSIG